MLPHTNIIQVFEMFQDEQLYYLVTEYFEGIDLIDAINEQTNKKRELWNEHEMCHIMTSILQAVNFCHKNGICHRDLKPENILINK